MNVLTPARAGAQLLSLVAFGSIARCYVAPWLISRPRADALIALLWVHVFRYVALQVFPAQHGGFPISDSAAMEIVVGDVADALLAYFSIALLGNRSRLAVPLVWLLVFETIYDIYSNIRGGVSEHLMGAASGVTWLILASFVPMVIVSLALIIWHLIAAAAKHSKPTSKAISAHAAGTALVTS